MKTAKEVLTKYSDGDYTQFQGYENILMAMDEYAKQYHESRMKEIPEIDNDTILALPLDVPSDEEIEKKAMNHNRTDNYTTIDYYSTGIIVGSKWVRDEILKRNK